MLKAGLVGAGHLGKIHLKLLNQSEKYDLVGFYDADPENGKKLEAEFGYKYFDDFDDLLSEIDTVSYTHLDVYKRQAQPLRHLWFQKKKERPQFP